jgi:peptidoglycan hydrolase-like protein with peptidoglycan-binding domain
MLKKYAPYIIAAVLVILLFFVFKPKATARTPITGGGATGGGTGTGTGGGATTPTGGGTLNRERLLMRGINGADAEVRELQRLLRGEGESISVDGIFGPLTEAALQRRRNRTSTTLNQFNAEAATGANTGGAGTGAPGPTPTSPTTAASIARALWENSGWSATAAGFIAAADGVINASPATLRAADTSARTQFAKGLREILDGTYLLPFYVTANQKRAAAYNALGAAGL